MTALVVLSSKVNVVNDWKLVPLADSVRASAWISFLYWAAFLTWSALVSGLGDVARGGTVVG